LCKKSKNICEIVVRFRRKLPLTSEVGKINFSLKRRNYIVMNKNIFLSLILIGSLLFGFSCKSKMVVKKLVNQDVTNTNKSQTKKIDGVMYHLPKTVVQITVPIKKITKTPGDFKDFVPCFFSESESDGMVTDESQSFSLMQPTFSSRGIPDTSETYVISTKGKYFETKTLFVEYGQGNVLQKGEAESKNDGLEFAVKAVATAASVAAKIAPLAVSADDDGNKIKKLVELKKEYKCYEALNTITTEQKKKNTNSLLTVNQAKGVEEGKSVPDAGKIAQFTKELQELTIEESKLDNKIKTLMLMNADVQNNMTGIIEDKGIEKDVYFPKVFDPGSYKIDYLAADTPGVATDKCNKASKNVQEQQKCDELKVIFEQSVDRERTKYQSALETFNELKKLEDQRNQVLGKDNLSVPVETYKAVLEKNEELIASYRAAFLGTVAPDIFPASFEYVPTKQNPYSPLLFTYSTEFGVCKDGLLKSKSIAIKPGFGFSKPNSADPDNPEKCGNTTETKIKAVWVNVKKSDEQNNFLAKIQKASEASEMSDKSRGWYYRIPTDADVSFLRSEIPCGLITGTTKYNCSPFNVEADDANLQVIYVKGGTVGNGGAVSKLNDNEQLAISEMQIAQLGIIASVPATTAGRSSSTSIVLDPATGAMKNYKSSSTALIDKSILEDAKKAADSIVDAADPLNKKKRELEELKTQNEINTERNKLTNSNTNSNSENPR
jgi:Domain of unknown function (DUF4831)